MALVKESVAKDALKSLTWDKLERHLDDVHPTNDEFDLLLGHVRRSDSLILRREGDPREARRDAFLQSLRDYASLHFPDCLEKIGWIEESSKCIEDGYREIMRVEATLHPSATPIERISAALELATRQFQHLETMIDDRLTSGGPQVMSSFHVGENSSDSVSPDNILSGIVTTLTSTLQLEGHRNQWFDDQSRLVLPSLVPVDDQQVAAAGGTSYLSAAWHQWEDMEKRHRYFDDGRLQISTPPNIPSWAQQQTKKTVERIAITEEEIYDFIANERLSERIGQNMLALEYETSAAKNSRGLGVSSKIAVGQFVSSDEALAWMSLSDILGYSILDDQEALGGLRLVEWVRGFAALKLLADADRPNGILLPRFTRAKLLDVLTRVGIGAQPAATFLANAALAASSRDLFDQPLIQIGVDEFLLFGPALYGLIISQATLSAIGNVHAQISKKGKAFEKYAKTLFEAHSLSAFAFKINREGEEYEYDLVVPWGEFVFLFECKNISLSGNNAVQAYYFDLEMRSAIRQVKRLERALDENRNVMLERFGVDISEKQIIPCVLNSLPYSRQGLQEGVYVTDYSSLKRLLSERHTHAIRVKRLPTGQVLQNKIPIKSFWANQSVEARDLVAYLNAPYGIEFALAHLQVVPSFVGLGEGTVGAFMDVKAVERTTESLAQAAGVDLEWLKGEFANSDILLDEMAKKLAET